MRTAVLIIVLCVTMIVLLQSCMVSIGGSLGDNRDLAGGGAVGVLIAFMFVLGAAFVLNLPKVSGVIFTLAGLLGLLVGFQSEFSDMKVWGGLAIVLAVMAFVGSRKQNTVPG